VTVILVREMKFAVKYGHTFQLVLYFYSY
jgi:hypothetical protein